MGANTGGLLGGGPGGLRVAGGKPGGVPGLIGEVPSSKYQHSNPQIDRKVIHRHFSRILLFYLFEDYYIQIPCKYH